MDWETVLIQPGHSGNKRDEIAAKFDAEYGKDSWRVAWQWGEGIIHFELACQMYEDGYYADSFKREDLWKELRSKARDVYDHVESDVESGLDYFVQKSESTHLQYISIRRVVLRRGWRFEGDDLIQIRSHSKYWGNNLSPGRVPFHLPDMIVSPHLESWWDYNSIEDFYQSNKVIQRLRK